MRIFMLWSVAALLAACSDNPQTTAPKSIGNATTATGARDRAPVVQAAGKPTDQVGFTKTTVLTSKTTLTAGAYGGGNVTCPAGTYLSGGGYWITLVNGATWPIVVASMPYSSGATYDGWATVLRNTQPGAADVVIVTYAVCAS